MVISSNSDFIHLENVAATEAQEKIAKSRIALEKLMKTSKTFCQNVSSIPHEFEFLFNYGQGSILLARQIGNDIEWTDKNLNPKN